MNNNDKLTTIENVDLETVVGGDFVGNIIHSDAVKHYTQGAKSEWSALKHLGKGEFKDAAKDAGNAVANNYRGHLDAADATYRYLKK